VDKVKQLADELYNQKVLDGWKNVSMEACLKRATDYYRMDEVVKKLTIPDVSGSFSADDMEEAYNDGAGINKPIEFNINNYR
jgi:hypothetical protein